MSKVGNYFSESAKELTEKVTWPTWPELQNSAIVVLVASVIIALFILAMDIASRNVLEFYYNMAS